jgi:hypothetical protein
MKFPMTTLVLAIALSGCATQFWGSAKVSGGVQGCRHVCDGWGMDLAGMVQMGEYSDGCICQTRPGPGAPPRADSCTEPPRGLAGQPAVAGVHLQMQAAAAAAQQQMTAAQRHTTPGLAGHP